MENIILLAIISICLWTDLKERKVYNKVLMPGLILGLAVNTLNGGIIGLRSSGLGFIIGLFLLIIPFIFGGIGGGDVKLLATIGAIKGPEFIFYTFLAMGLSGAVIAIGILIWEKRMLKGLKNIYLGFKLMIVTRFKIISFNGDEKENMFPYGVAISIGTVVAFSILGG